MVYTRGQFFIRIVGRLCPSSPLRIKHTLLQVTTHDTLQKDIQHIDNIINITTTNENTTDVVEEVIEVYSYLNLKVRVL